MLSLQELLWGRPPCVWGERGLEGWLCAQAAATPLPRLGWAQVRSC